MAPAKARQPLNLDSSPAPRGPCQGARPFPFITIPVSSLGNRSRTPGLQFSFELCPEGERGGIRGEPSGQVLWQVARRPRARSPYSTLQVA